MSLESNRKEVEEKRAKILKKITLPDVICNKDESLNKLFIDSLELGKKFYSEILMNMSMANRKSVGDLMQISTAELVRLSQTLILKQQFSTKKEKLLQSYLIEFERFRSYLRYCIECGITQPNQASNAIVYIVKIQEYLYPMIKD